MKTAIIKTDFWKDDDVFDLLPEARLYYMCILTNPERNGTPAFKCSDRQMSYFTGFNQNVIQTCKKQLLDAGLIEIVDGYYIMREQDHVKPHKGKLSLTLTSQEYEKLPDSVRELLMSRSGATHERIGIGNSISKSNGTSNSKSIITPLDENAVRLATMLQTSIQENFEFVKVKDSDIERWAKDIEKIHRIDGYQWNIIEATLKWSQEDSFWKQNIRSGDKFRKKFEQLLIRIKGEIDKGNAYGADII